ncbi:methyltransferase [Brachybacterium sp. FME24]|uniref:class I SAM-dependent methyltransferase n=1 Tax=Brachybacterium sp. FME24 TaxID=2742605 RepID=UPI00186775B7|nr:methyltransferase [Brachybacterium sp. FME24]
MTDQSFTTPSDVSPHGPDQSDRVILRTAVEEGGFDGSGPVLVVDDMTGELTAAALREIAAAGDTPVVSWSPSHATTLALQARFSEEITAGRLEILSGEQPVPLVDVAAGIRPRLALLRLSKSLADLELRARSLAAGGVQMLVAGGRVKHMTRTQNEVLSRVFAEVHASKGLGKSRALVATTPHPDLEPATAAASSTRIQVRGHERTLQLRGLGGVFGGASADAGSLLLLGALDRALVAGTFGEQAPRGDGSRNRADDAGGTSAADAETPIARAIDLGSGNGLLTAYLAAALSDAHVLGSDDDADAVVSTRATLDANALQKEGVEVAWDDSLSRVADRSVDLVLLNPPFHDGTGIDATLVHGLLDAAVRVLRPGGQLWFVHNSYLRYRTEVEHRVGPVRQRSRDRRFTVLSAQRV